MDGYPGITMSDERVEFSNPFKPFIHRWEMFAEARNNESEAEAKAHVDSLYEVLATELNDVITCKTNLVLYGMITFNMLWTIFEPGHIVFHTVDGRKRAFRLERSGHGSDSKAYEIHAVYIDYNGYGFGYRKYNLFIPAFEGTKPIISLPVIPYACHHDKGTLRQSLTVRGKLWHQYKGYHYKQYKGLALTSYMGRKTGHNLSSRVIIDTEAYLAFHSDKCTMDLEDISDLVADEQFLIATPVLRGYSLEDRKWLKLFLDGVSDIVWKLRPFDSLVLRDGDEKDVKDLVLALASSQSRQSEISDDVLQGQGRSVIMLLHGPPGVGKTLTAECVAEFMKVPLYVLSARALGTTTARVKESMDFILRIITKWNAVLLLEDADIFIQPPNPTDFQKSEVSYDFLTLLEHFEGILFLASECVETIDPAFETRIDATIRYPELDTYSRRHIWEQLLGKADREAISKSDIIHMADRELNGRQIKNVVKASRTLAHYQGTKLGYAHVLTVLNLAADRWE
ncbi:hypothetical protein AbraCBS73388_009547 [Aspergillus brasiliensis]|uniref:AAA+ ATPase domain-containing protein n=1 Tax=Aspergillus brasiliensis TaxID=319629 RepID=A0A9W6DPX7_9EURO|nr:hypothetical protein AbraCBS73388_009547 [Aspergillus brasiliensis]